MTGGSRSTAALIINEWATTIAVVVALILPWVMDGWPPSPSLRRRRSGRRNAR